MDKLTLLFVDDTNTTETIKISRTKFIYICNSIPCPYFTRMLNDFIESTQNEIEIHVPFASAASELIDDYINGTCNIRTANDLIKRIYCMDFLGIDTMGEFSLLLKMDINYATYDLVHKFVDQKSYANKLYIEFMARKLPTNYNTKIFPNELIRQMVNVTNHNLLIWHNGSTVSIHHLNGKKKFFCTPDRPPLKIESIEVNPVYPIIAVLYTSKLVLYDTLTLKELHVLRKGIYHKHYGGEIMSYCFASDGNLLYICRHRQILVHDIHARNLRLVTSFNIDYRATHMQCSPDNKLLAFTTNEQPNNKIPICMIDLSTRITKCVHSSGAASIFNFRFINATTLTFCENYIAQHRQQYYDHISGNCNVIENVSFPEEILYVVDDNTADTRDDISKYRFYPAKCVITHPDLNLAIKYMAIKWYKQQSNGVVIRNGVEISNILTIPDGFDKSYCAFSTNGKYIYSLIDNSSCMQIAIYRFDAKGNVTLKKILPEKIELTRRVGDITNVVYPDEALAKKLNLQCK